MCIQLCERDGYSGYLCTCAGRALGRVSSNTRVLLDILDVLLVTDLKAVRLVAFRL